MIKRYVSVDTHEPWRSCSVRRLHCPRSEPAVGRSSESLRCGRTLDPFNEASKAKPFDVVPGGGLVALVTLVDSSLRQAHIMAWWSLVTLRATRRAGRRMTKLRDRPLTGAVTDRAVISKEAKVTIFCAMAGRTIQNRFFRTQMRIVQHWIDTAMIAGKERLRFSIPAPPAAKLVDSDFFSLSTVSTSFSCCMTVSLSGPRCSRWHPRQSWMLA